MASSNTAASGGVQVMNGWQSVENFTK